MATPQTSVGSNDISHQEAYSLIFGLKNIKKINAVCSSPRWTSIIAENPCTRPISFNQPATLENIAHLFYCVKQFFQPRGAVYSAQVIGGLNVGKGLMLIEPPNRQSPNFLGDILVKFQ